MLTVTAQFVGVAILAAALAQVLVWLASGVRRAVAERERDRLAAEILRQRLDAARAHSRRREDSSDTWMGFRKFEVQRKVHESEDVCSFYLAPHDGRTLPGFEPGQFLTFQLRIPGSQTPVTRCYSLSDRPHPDVYRISVKRIPPPRNKTDAPPGLASNFMHDFVNEQSILDVKAPTGHFSLDPGKPNPVVLIAGGIGVTPLLSMLTAIAESGAPREVWFFYGVDKPEQLLERGRLEDLSLKHGWLRLNFCLSRSPGGETRGLAVHHESIVSVDLMRELLPSNNYDFYTCGPPPMMEAITSDLRTWGVPDDRIHYEAFGAPSVKSTSTPVPSLETGRPPMITFSRTNHTCEWNAEMGSLLDFAASEGVAMDSGCRAGNCGTCLTAIQSGEVDYVLQPGAEIEPGTCLTCIAKPKTDLVLDA